MNTTDAAITAEVKKTILGMKPGDEKGMILLTGTYKDPFKGKDLIIAGSLEAPADFYEKKVVKNTMFEPKNCSLQINRKELKIVLFCGERDEFKTEITGALRTNKDLEGFGINTDKRWLAKDLSRFLRMKSFFFQDRAVAEKLGNALLNFTAKFEAEIEKADDLKANTVDSYKTKLSTSIDLFFTLNMPVYIGTKQTPFRVEVCIDVADPKNVKFWLESVQLEDLAISVRDSSINEQVSKFTEIVTIELV
jgi:hypothetical protein